MRAWVRFPDGTAKRELIHVEALPRPGDKIYGVAGRSCALVTHITWERDGHYVPTVWVR